MAILGAVPRRKVRDPQWLWFASEVILISLPIGVAPAWYIFNRSFSLNFLEWLAVGALLAIYLAALVFTGVLLVGWYEGDQVQSKKGSPR